MKLSRQIAAIGGLRRMRDYGSMGQRESRNVNSYYAGPQGKQIILIAFLLSVIIHASTIMAFQGILPLPWFRGKHAYRVYLMRPPVKEIMKDSEENQPATSQIPTEPPVENKEATISLDTRDPTYHPYTKLLKDRILSHWMYPLSARENLIQGSLLIVFRLDRDGNLISCDIARSSGHGILDTYALDSIRSATPFPPFPEDIQVQFLNINASFAYQLTFEQ
ncbi:MAG: energy transducer TonB [Deltaproteobacteria bacterium]|nr:MAG: energy transducer TonB [Deltaproteobacteria bacterium]